MPPPAQRPQLLTPGATYNYSIGAGGNRGLWNNNFFTNAGAGGTSNFHGNVFRGNGGSAGFNSTPSQNSILVGQGSLGGNATGGTYNVTGTVGTTVHEGRIHKGLVAGVLGALGGTTVDKDGTILSNASAIGSATVGQGGQGSVGGYNEDGYAGSAGSLIVYEFG